MKATAVEVLSAFPPGHPAGVPQPEPTSLSLLTGIVTFSGLVIARIAAGGPFDSQALRRIFLVAGPITILTSYPGFPPQGTASKAGGLLIQVASAISIALQGSFTGLFAYTLGQAGDYGEGVVGRRTRGKIAALAGPEAPLSPGATCESAQGDTILLWGRITTGGLTVERRRWGPPTLELLRPGDVVKPGDTVLAGTATIEVDQVADLAYLDNNPMAHQVNGVTALRPGHDNSRLRRQFFFWSVTVAALTLILSRSLHRSLGVLLAGSPAFMDVVGGATSWQETAKWERKGILPGHPLSLVAAAEVDTILFDEPQTPSPERLMALAPTVAQLKYYRYRVGLVTNAPEAAAEAAAKALGADLWFSGAPAERALWVASQFEQRLVAVIGASRESVPAMATAHLAVACAPDPAAATAAHLVMTGPLSDLPSFLADVRQAGRAEQHGATITKSLMVAATIAAGVGLVAATNVVTITSLLGLTLVGLKQFLGGSKRGTSTAEKRH